MHLQDIEKNPDNIKLVIEQFEKWGFTKLEKALTPAEAEAYHRCAIDLDATEKNKVDAGLRDEDIDFQTYNFTGSHHYNSPRQTRVFDELLGHKTVISILDAIFDAPCILSQTELRNPAHNLLDSGANTWHRDGRKLLKANLWVIVFWLFNDVTTTNGPTDIKPETQYDTNSDDSLSLMQLTGNAGDIVLMNSNLLHRATLNTDGQHRWIFIPTYIPWFIKPSADFTKMFDKETFDNFSDELKQVFGYTSIVPVDERKRLYTLRPWQEILDEIPFPTVPKDRA
jgi:ectoine hydroxylase-related dioxygenase (phytanoyl-CoA dioxygenase family)